MRYHLRLKLKQQLSRKLDGVSFAWIQRLERQSAPHEPARRRDVTDEVTHGAMLYGQTVTA